MKGPLCGKSALGAKLEALSLTAALGDRWAAFALSTASESFHTGGGREVKTAAQIAAGAVF